MRGLWSETLPAGARGHEKEKRGVGEEGGGGGGGGEGSLRNGRTNSIS